MSKNPIESSKNLQPVPFTNQVLKCPGKTTKQDVYYIPGYLRIKCKNFVNMDLQNLKGTVNVSVIFDIYYGNLPEKIVEFLKTGMVLEFGRNDAIALTEQDDNDEKVTIDNSKQTEKLLKFTLRQNLEMKIEADVFYTPFETINFILSIVVPQVKIEILAQAKPKKKKKENNSDSEQDKDDEEEEERDVVDNLGTVKINLMDHDWRYLKNSYSQDKAYGRYTLIGQRMNSMFTNEQNCKVNDFKQQVKNQSFEKSLERKKDMTREKKTTDEIENFNIGHFLIPLYRHPTDSLMIIFFPLWLLSIINLAIYFQQVTMGGRMGSLTTLLVAYMALIPTIRQYIPPSKKIVVIEIIVYLNATTTFFTLIESINVRNKGDYYFFVWNRSVLFILSVIITIASIVIVIFMLLIHWRIWQPQYKIKEQGQIKKLCKTEWKNQNCDKYFVQIAKALSQNKIKPFPGPESEKMVKKIKKGQKAKKNK